MTSFVSIGPRQMTRMPWRSIGCSRSPWPPCALSAMPSINGTLGPYTSASISPTRRCMLASASARFVATVDLPTPPLPLATARMLRTPGMGCGPRRCCGTGAAVRATFTVPATPGIAPTVACTAASISATTSSLAVLGASVTVMPSDATSTSFTRPNETMSREKPG